MTSLSAALSAVDARRIAIASQGLDRARPRRPTAAAIAAMVDRLGVVQIDSVNVLARSHYLVAWSRLGAYDPAAFDRLSHAAPRRVFEYWGHEASLLPIAVQPLLRWRMARAASDAWGRMRAISRRRAFVARVLAAVGELGPVTAGDLERALAARPRTERGWWAWSEVKVAIEWLFWTGAVTSARRVAFERRYDLAERVLPATTLAAPTPPEADATRALVERAARALGVASEADLRDYYRLRLDANRAAVRELVAAGVLREVAVEGWRRPGYLHRDAPRPRAIAADRATLLSPFDSLIWTRDRTARLFGMQFRLEIYTPAEKRVHGYYVLPVLRGEQLVGRLDLKADRAASTLRVQAAHAEAGIVGGDVAPAIAAELRALASWLGLAEVAVTRRGDLARVLAGAVA